MSSCCLHLAWRTSAYPDGKKQPVISVRNVLATAPFVAGVFWKRTDQDWWDSFAQVFRYLLGSMKSLACNLLPRLFGLLLL